jgi:hypothetical protein
MVSQIVAASQASGFSIREARQREVISKEQQVSAMKRDVCFYSLMHRIHANKL